MTIKKQIEYRIPIYDISFTIERLFIINNWLQSIQYG